MPKLYSSKQVSKALMRAGFIKISQKGSHIKFRGIWKGKLKTAIVPNHRQIARGTFRSILEQSSLTEPEFESFVR